MERRQFIKMMFAAPVALAVPTAALRRPALPEIILLETVVAGFQYYRGEDVWEKLREGDVLRLIREPGNPYDEKAVEVFWRDRKLGYLPRVDNSVIAQMMDRGVPMKAMISRLARSYDPWERVGVKVMMEGEG